MSKIIIPFELYSSKNSRQTFMRNGKIINIKSKQALSNEKELIDWLVLNKHAWDYELTQFICQQEYEKKDYSYYPLKIYIKIYRETNRKFDYLNIYQNLFDCMVKAEWLPDDDMNHLIPIFEGWEKDKENPRVELSLFTEGE